jgi:chromosome segregation ATPase
MEAIDVHPESQIGQNQARVHAHQAKVAPLEAQLVTLTNDRAAHQAILDGGTLEDDPLRLAASQIRIGLLDREIERLMQALQPARREGERLAEELSQSEGQYQSATQQLEVLRDVTHHTTYAYAVGDWHHKLRSLRQQIQQLGEAPTEGMHYEPIIEIRYDVRG